MQIVDGNLVYSATDLVGFLECGHLTSLERGRNLGPPWQGRCGLDPVLDRIAQRGQLHEERFLESLKSEGIDVVRGEPDPELPFDQRLAAGRDLTLGGMRAGADVIYQAVLFDGRRLGYADFLRRVPRPSGLGDWSYEVWDTKLARHAKASAVLQLCMYSELLTKMQGKPPAEMHLALGGVHRETVSFRFADYGAYYRLMAREFETVVNGTPDYPPATVPEPVEHCAVCRWSAECSARWRSQDDLALVANLSSRQRHALHDVGVTTRSRLAEPPDALDRRPEGIGREALERIHAPGQDPGGGRAGRRGDFGAPGPSPGPRWGPGPQSRPADAARTLGGRPVLRHRGRPLLRLGRG